ncbi:hypothetical protein BH11MYX4_BH11MYX4_49190 [soil metagenome]
MRSFVDGPPEILLLGVSEAISDYLGALLASHQYGVSTVSAGEASPVGERLRAKHYALVLWDVEHMPTAAAELLAAPEDVPVVVFTALPRARLPEPWCSRPDHYLPAPFDLQELWDVLLRFAPHGRRRDPTEPLFVGDVDIPLHARDFDAACALYCERLGFEIVEDTARDPTRNPALGRSVILGYSATPALRVELFEGEDSSAGPPWGRVPVLTLRVTDCERVRQELLKYGGAEIEEFEDAPTFKRLTLADPSGNVIVVVESPRHV